MQRKHAEARKLWLKYCGYIPKGFIIHHKDGDPSNNNILNLACVTTKHHGKLHKELGTFKHGPTINRVRGTDPEDFVYF